MSVLVGGGPLLERIVLGAAVVRADVALDVPPIDPALGEWTALRPASMAHRHRGTPERQWFESPRVHYTWEDEQHGRNDLQMSRGFFHRTRD
jgi:hypothetical protein